MIPTRHHDERYHKGIELSHVRKKIRLLANVCDHDINKVNGPLYFDAFFYSTKLCGNCAFLKNFHTRKLGEIKVFFAV